MFFRNFSICRSLFIAFQSLALVFLLASSIWASPDRSHVLVSDQNSVAMFFKTANGSDADDLDLLISGSNFVFNTISCLSFNKPTSSLYKHGESSVYLARAPPLPSGF